MKSNLLMIVTVACLLFSTSVFAQLPQMPASGGFALFTSDGDINNNGASYIVGHIGTNAGSITGFPPGTLIGQQFVSDTTTALIVRELDSIYNLFNFVPCDSVLAAALGASQTLTPGVYCINSAATLGGNLILDGLGDTDAVFVFKIDGSLTASAFSNVVLIGLVDASQVFWRLNGSFELGDTSVFAGNLLGNGAINLLDGASILGRAMTLLGDITINEDLIVLPIQLISFNANCTGNNIEVKWATASELNNDYFNIEMSEDGRNWEKAATITGAGNTNSTTNYAYVLRKPSSAIVYLRLRQTDFNGSSECFDAIALLNCGVGEKQFSVYPNPVKGILRSNNYSIPAFFMEE